LIDRALTTPETNDLTAWLDAARTTGLAGYDEPASTPPGYTYVYQIPSTQHRIRIDGGNAPYKVRAIGANSAEVEYDAETTAGAATTRDLFTDGLTAPVDIYVDNNVLTDTGVNHLAVAPNNAAGSALNVSGMTGLVELYQGLNSGLAIFDVTGLSSLQTFWAQGNNATSWPTSSLPSSLTDLRLNDNAFPEAEVDTVLSQAASAPLANATVDLSGTSMANASSTGWGHKDTLESAGCTVLLSGTDPRQSAPSNLIWRPGQYLLLPYDDAVVASWLTTYQNSVIRGFLSTHDWIELEASKDNYSALHSLLDRKMALAANAGTTLYGDVLGFMLRIQTKQFNTNILYPSYIQPYLDYNLSGHPHAPLGDPYVQERIELIFEEIATYVGTDQHFRGVTLPETAIAFTDPVSAQKEAYCEGQAYLGRRMAELIPNYPSAAYFNSGTSQGVYFSNQAPFGLGIGGPDVYVHTYDRDRFLAQAYDVRKSLFGQCAAIQEVQTHNWGPFKPKFDDLVNYVDQDGIIPPKDIMDFCLANDLANYLIWLPTINYLGGDAVNMEPRLQDFLINDIPTLYPGDPAGGLPSAVPTNRQT